LLVLLLMSYFLTILIDRQKIHHPSGEWLPFDRIGNPLTGNISANHYPYRQCLYSTLKYGMHRVREEHSHSADKMEKSQ
jgi:hypothetical protein